MTHRRWALLLLAAVALWCSPWVLEWLRPARPPLPPGTGECNPTLIFPLAAIPLGLLALVGWPVWTIVRLLERRRAPPAPPPNFEDAPPGDTLGG